MLVKIINYIINKRTKYISEKIVHTKELTQRLKLLQNKLKTDSISELNKSKE